MELIEDKNFLRDDQKQFINEVLLSPSFPYYLNPNCVGPDGNQYMGHCVLRRPEERPPEEGLNSDYGSQMLDMFKTFIIKNKVECKQILRCNINLTFKTKSSGCGIHEDHDYPHKVLLLYLNECTDKTTRTYLLDEKQKKVLHKIKPEQYKGVCFDSMPHYFDYPKKDIRVVAVYTFT